MQINLKFVILSLSGSTRNADFDYENVIWNTSRFLNNSSIIPSYLTFKMWVNHTGIIDLEMAGKNWKKALSSFTPLPSSGLL